MFPSEKKINRFKEFMQRFGLDFEITKDTNLAEYFKSILNNPSLKSSVK